jgi:hypothetical protein
VNVENNLIGFNDNIIKCNNSRLALSDVHKVQDCRLRIALIKPDAVLSLYHSGYGDETAFVQKAERHWGPIGLFHSEYFLTDYYIIYVDHGDPHTSQWVEPLIDCWTESPNLSQPIQVPRRPIEGYFVQAAYRTYAINITKNAVLPKDIPWHKYDIVISYSPAVSPDIISKYPSTIWAYWIIEGCQRSYIQSRKGHLVHGWDLFLTQDFNLFTTLPKNVVEFPLTFDYHGGLADLLRIDATNDALNFSNNHTNEEIASTVRSGILLLPSHLSLNERHILERIQYMDSRQNISKNISLTVLNGTTPHTMKLNMQNKYAVVWNRTSRGNALGEAWSSGLLVLGHIHDRVINQDIVRISECEFESVEELVKKIIELEQNEQMFFTYLRRQKKLFDMLAFYRPLRDLIEKGLKIVKKRLHGTPSNLKTIENRRLPGPTNIFTSWH